MKLKNRQDDASAPLNEWLKMYDWFAELRDDDPAEPTDHGLAEPADEGDPRPETPSTTTAPPASWPAAVAEASAGTETSARADTLEITPPPTPPHGAVGATRREDSPLRATIGDQLRRPVAWCEMGSCIWHHADPAALGEADIRDRAISAGWRVDALGRLACPRCQQTSPDFRAARPVTLWDRDNAITSAALTIAVMRYRRAASSPGWRAAEVIPAGQAAAISRHPAPGTVPETPCPPASRPAQQEHATRTPRHRRRETPTGQQGHGEALAGTSLSPQTPVTSARAECRRLACP
jgi:hypothetical protein